MKFRIGAFYTRERIQEELGGENETYLPQKDNRIVCGCFTQELSPLAPYLVLVGDAPKVVNKARILIMQWRAIPVFMKRAVNKWEYVGKFRVKAHSTDPEEIKLIQQHVGRDAVIMVLYLGKVDE
jgi:hypothetical protein